MWGSDGAGLISLVVWCFEPNIMGHAELITPDCAATSFGLGAAYVFWRWLKQPSWPRAILAGFLLGIAQLTKTTWIVLFGLWPALWILYRVAMKGRRCTTKASLREQIGQCGAIVLVGLYVLNLGYAFDGTFERLERLTFVSSALTGEERSGTPGNRFVGTVLGALPVPLPEQYLLGIDVQKQDLEDFGRPSYLRGEWRDGGWWYYYLYCFAVKTTMGVQFLVFLGAVTLMLPSTERSFSSVRGGGGCAQNRLPDGVMVLLLPPLVVFCLVSTHLEFNHHCRYVLPAVGFACVFVGSPAKNGLGSSRIRRYAVAAGLTATVGASLANYPHQLAYFNALAGGPSEGYKHVLGSNLDWGQDFLLAREIALEEGYSGGTVRVVSCGGLREMGQMIMNSSSGNSEPCVKDAEWELVSINEVVSPGSPWKEEMTSRSSRRIGYTMWMFRRE